MPDRYIKRKRIIFERIAEKGDTDQVAKIQKENRQLTEKVDKLEGEYRKVREALEFIMPIVESMDPEDLNKKMFEKRKKELSVPTAPPPPC